MLRFVPSGIFCVILDHVKFRVCVVGRPPAVMVMVSLSQRSISGPAKATTVSFTNNSTSSVPIQPQFFSWTVTLYLPLTLTRIVRVVSFVGSQRYRTVSICSASNTVFSYVQMRWSGPRFTIGSGFMYTRIVSSSTQPFASRIRSAMVESRVTVTSKVTVVSPDL